MRRSYRCTRSARSQLAQFAPSSRRKFRELPPSAPARLTPHLWKSLVLLDELRQRRGAIHRARRHCGGRRFRVFGSTAVRKQPHDSGVDVLSPVARAYDLLRAAIPPLQSIVELTNHCTGLGLDRELSTLASKAVDADLSGSPVRRLPRSCKSVVRGIHY